MTSLYNSCAMIAIIAAFANAPFFSAAHAAEHNTIKPATGIYDVRTAMFDEGKLKSLVKAMTAEEKAKILNGTGMSTIDNIGASDGRVPGSGGQTHPIARLGIPDIVVSDGPSGLRIVNTRENDDKTYNTTGFPVETVIGSSWSRDIAYAVGLAIGTEAKEYGVDILLAPGVNIQRNPLNGRNFEYFSEDPVLSGVLGASFINGAQSLNIGTSLKHYAANNAETNRSYSNSLVSERALREVYLRPFEIAIKSAQPWTVMTSYNKLNNIYTSERHDLNKQILRDEWGFKGLVMTDWFSAFSGKEQLLDPNFVNDVYAQVASGNDLIMPSMDRQLLALTDDIKSGRISQQDTDFAVENVLRMVFRSPSTLGYKFSNQPDLKANAELARAVAAEGIVLLKNDNTLPLKINETIIAPFGVGSYHLITGGTGSSEVTTAYRVPIAQGLKNNKATLYEPVYKQYKPFVDQKVQEDIERRSKLTKLDPFNDIPEMDISNDAIIDSAQNSDVALFAIGRNSAEQHDQSLDSDYHLSKSEISLLDRLSTAYREQGKKLIVVLNVPTAIDTSWSDKADAILVSWYGGQEGGNAVADIVSGAINPSGKLTQTFAKQYTDLPSADSFLGTPKENPTNISYTEGIYVGYRYFDGFGIEPAYPFGFGMSYTNFEYSELTLDTKNFETEINFTVKVTNTGKVAGKEAVQLYISAPQSGIDKPAKELKDFAKTALLQPGSSEVVKMKIDLKGLASFQTDKSEWIADKGTYEVLIGRSSTDIILKDNFELAENRVAEKVNRAFSEKLPFEDLVRPVSE